MPKNNKKEKKTGSAKRRPLEKSKSSNQARPNHKGGNQKLITPLSGSNLFLHGRHSVEAALKNPRRQCLRLVGTRKAITQLNATRQPKHGFEVIDDMQTLSDIVDDGSPHQGIILEVAPLPEPSIEDFAPIDGGKNILLMLDQVTDPHNVGACLRSAAALGARGLITQDKNSPPETGVLARASSGGLEVLPWYRAVNLAQTLEQLRDIGYWSVGLDGSTKTNLKDVSMGDNIVIVMGSEGKGLRPLVKKHCDMIAKIPMTDKIESLNVSNAAAIALYEIAMRSV
jgi:23S rRNA (guanosine2251-2'-O)-methyltransferase